MTREEAIAYWKQRSEHIHKWLEENEDVDFIGEYVEAIDMAIDALKTDTVSREEYEEVKAYMDTLVDAFIEDGKELAESVKVVRCKDCRWYRDTFFDTEITPTCDRHIDDRYGTLVGGITEDSFCSYGERREPNE